MEELEKALQEKFDDLKKDLSKGFATNEAIENALKTLEEVKDGLKTATEAQKAEMETLKDAFKSMKGAFGGEISQEVKDSLAVMVKENHAKIVEVIKAQDGKFEFEFKVANPHMTNNGTVTPSSAGMPTSPNASIEWGLIEKPREKEFILQVIPNRQVSKVPPTKTIFEEGTKEGDAALTAEGAVKPLIQYKAVQTTYTRSKFAGRIEWSEEFEMDYEALLNAFLDMLRRDVLKAWQDSIVNEIETNATAYVSSALDGTLVRPDNGLAIVAIQSQIQSLNFTPDTVIMNPADFTTLAFQQNTSGDFVLSPYIDIVNRTINGMRVFLSTSITAGEVLVGDSNAYKEEHSRYIFRAGQYNDQLIKNMYTAIGEVFSILYYAELYKPSWVKGDLDAIKTALQKV